MENTKIVQFSPAYLLSSTFETIFGEDLPVITNAINFLGLQLVSQLSWKSHTYFLLKKLNSGCFITRKLSLILNKQTLWAVYFIHFHALVNYGIIFWCNTSSMFNFCSYWHWLPFKHSYLCFVSLLHSPHFMYILSFNIFFDHSALCTAHFLTWFIFIHRWINELYACMDVYMYNCDNELD
jgi:hypothetical protein